MLRQMTCHLTLIWGLGVAATAPAQAPPGPLDERVGRLIRELGDEEFAIRERAQSELAGLGLAAFDALNEAVYDDDIEISLRARYLLRSMSVQWYREDDPAQLKQLLEDYGSQSSTDRRSRVDSVAKLEQRAALAALCRLARYDTDPRLSKLAALRAMQREPQAPRQEAETIERAVGNSKRPGAKWLSLYVKLLRGDADSLPQWDQVIRDERQTLVSAATRTSLQLVRDLSRWQVAQLRRHDRQEQAADAILRSLELIDGSREQVLENALWLIELKAWPAMAELAERHPVYFNTLVKFKYLIAEAERGQHKPEQAEQTAEEALQLNPDAHEEHIEAAVLLKDRGLRQWAAAEFQERIDKNPEGSVVNLRARFLYSEMLHDGELDDMRAAEVLQGAVEAMQDPAANQRARVSLQRDPELVKSRMHYFFARGHVANSELKQARQHLEQAIQIYSEDPDVLIAMHRLPGQDDAWKASVVQRIEATARKLRAQIEQHRNVLQRRTSGPIRQQYERQLSSLNNQYAWLIANTEGDYRDALRASQQSLELTPGSPIYQDTLGRCYYAVGDYENAVKLQRLACAQMPHSRLMRKQLELFEAALEKEQEQPS